MAETNPSNQFQSRSLAADTRQLALLLQSALFSFTLSRLELAPCIGKIFFLIHFTFL